MRLRAAVVVATAVLATAGCTGDDQPPNADVTPSAGGSAAPMTYEEAQRKVPVDGTKDLPITWDLAGAPDTDEVLEARRSLVFLYWLRSSPDWAPISPVGQMLYTDKLYEQTLAPLATSKSDNPVLGPLWFKFMGAEKSGADETTVTFCTDRGHWRGVNDKGQVGTKRWNLESYVMKQVQTGDGERRWLTDGQIDNDIDREKQHGAQCRTFAQHRKP